VSVVKINVLTVPPEMREELERRFAGRAGLVESAEGFEGFELLRPVEGQDRYFVMTHWRSEEDFQRWTKSQSFERGHAQAAKDAQAAEARDGGHGPSGGQGHPGGQGHGHGRGGPAATGSELWGFEVIESAAPKSAGG
jgi:heme oxygenase (mycobilin-producing)